LFNDLPEKVCELLWVDRKKKSHILPTHLILFLGQLRVTIVSISVLKTFYIEKLL